MQIVSYYDHRTLRYGASDGQGLWPLGPENAFPALLNGFLADPALLAKARTLVAGTAAARPLAGIAYAPAVPLPGKILCVGLNYEAHRIETGRPKMEHPVLFTRFASSQVAHEAPLLRPRVSRDYDFEGELALVIGRGGRHIAREEAFAAIAGYCCYNDGSVRDWQRHTSQFTPGKNFDASGSIGPWIVPTDEVGDPAKLTLETRVNGAVMQQSGVDDLIFDVPTLIAYCSSFATLNPGDVIATGTPGGVGFVRQPPVFLKAGDRVDVTITKIGTLSNPVIDEV